MQGTNVLRVRQLVTLMVANRWSIASWNNVWKGGGGPSQTLESLWFLKSEAVGRMIVILVIW